MILGVVDRATGLHQAGILDDRNSETCFQLLHDLWLRPFGLPLRLLCDPDPSFKGMFQHRVQAIGIHLDYCPPEAHHIIGMIERRNSVLRLILEKLIDQFAVDIPERCQVLVSAACHAINSQIQTHGRSAYQAVFGRQPRLLDSNFNDPMILATSSSAIRDETNPGLRADLVRNEAIKTLHNLDVSQHLRRALLRKTRKTNIADLQPGQKCAFWRWSRRGGPRKRGTWVIGRFLSWDPSHPGKQAWIRSGATTILATAEQIRAAFGFEDWAPDLQDIAALKNASTSFTDQLLDDRGPEPPDLNIEDDDIFDPESAAIPPTPSMMVPATPVPQTEPPAKPASSSMQPRQSDTVIQQQSTIQVNIDSPTHITNKTMQFQRFGDIPTRSRKHRSRTPNSRRIEARDKPVSQPPAELPPAEAPTILPPAATMTDEQPSTLTLPQPTEEQQSLEHMPPQTVSQFLGQGDTILDPTEPEQHQPGPTQGSTAQSSASQTMQHDVVPETPQVIEVEDDSTDNMLPQKRTFDSLITLRPLGHNKIQRVSSQWDGSPLIGFGPKSNRYHKAYLTTHQRKQDVLQENKPPEEPDTTDDSSSDETEQVNKPQTMQLALKTSSKQKQSGKTALQPMQQAYKQGMTRQEVKALDREIPWRTILSMPPSYVDKFLAAIDKEAVAWQQWQSVEPLSDKQAQEVFSDPVLSKRILPSRACYRDKACGIGDVVAKCRIVALGHLDPDLQQLSRNASTPGRIAEHIMLLMIVSGSNRCLLDTQQLWITWIGDAKTAFLQGVQDPQERDGPLFMRPPRDGLISRTNHWTAALYRIRGNVYGLANAPITWQREVCRRLAHLKFTQHMFDKQLYVKYTDSGEVQAAVLVYVDDFVGVYRQDFPIQQVYDLFQWGSRQELEVGKPVTFKGKELTLIEDKHGKINLHITMKKFIQGLDTAKVIRGRNTDDHLNEHEQKELRSVCGCLQWLATQCRPEVAASVSLVPHGAEARVNDLKSLYGMLDYIKNTPDQGLLIPCVPLNRSSVVVAYSDSSWNNAYKSGSQIGTLIGITSPEVFEAVSSFVIIDWKSSRSPKKFVGRH